ncbi:metal-sensing transcriptional repressor [Aestuariispira ectoiniformans]|uniref:metal-sensing transcriptional repressor n=1 Tax=Aestuariispira ectoiniformans TaxID=2775080 RepID=UPI00223BB8E3|nr:metal-sensing transcriptional repressor [Aestuariispira ectoiniformans]
MIHSSHTDVTNRLKRAEGHLRKIIAMMEGERACVDIAQQLHAVEAAVAKAKQTLIHDHIDHCLEQAVMDGRKPKDVLNEFKEISKYL